jgi:hypothetical protein
LVSGVITLTALSLIVRVMMDAFIVRLTSFIGFSSVALDHCVREHVAL